MQNARMSDSVGVGAPRVQPASTKRRAVISTVDQMVWAGQNFIALLSVSQFLDAKSLGAFSVLSAFIALLTGGVMHGIGEYLSVADRGAMQQRHRSARASLYRRAMGAGVVGAFLLAVVGFSLSSLLSWPTELRSALMWGSIAIVAVMPFEAMRAWLLLTRQVEQALSIDFARFGLHGGLTILLPAMGVAWSLGEIIMIWSLSALTVVLTVDGEAFFKSILGKIPESSSFDLRRQARYATDYLLLQGPEQAAIWVIAAVATLERAGSFKLVFAAFLPANALVQGLRAFNTVPDERSDERARSGGQRVLKFAIVGLAGVVVVAALLYAIPGSWLARVAGDDWLVARTGVPGMALQRLGAAVVVFGVLFFRWRSDDRAASNVRQIFAVFVLIGAALTGITSTVASATMVFGVVALVGGTLAAGWALRTWQQAAAGTQTG